MSSVFSILLREQDKGGEGRKKDLSPPPHGWALCHARLHHHRRPHPNDDTVTVMVYTDPM
jgi:hypothetical protein